MPSKNRGQSQKRGQSKGKTKCALKFCKNNLTQKAKQNAPKLCKGIGIMLSSLATKKKFNVKKCIKNMESRIQEMCEKTNCNPSCTDVPNVDAKDIKDGFNKKMNPAINMVFQTIGAESGCYNDQQMTKMNVTLKHLKEIVKKSKKSKSKKSKK